MSWEEKFALDVWYVDHWSLGRDPRIIGMTVLKVLKREGISADGEATMPEFNPQITPVPSSGATGQAQIDPDELADGCREKAVKLMIGDADVARCRHAEMNARHQEDGNQRPGVRGLRT